MLKYLESILTSKKSAKNDDKIDITLIPTTSLSKCYLIVTYEEFEGLLNSIEWKPMGKVAKIKYLLDMLLENFAGTLQFSIVRNSISPILVSACVDLPETYPDGTTVSDEEVKKKQWICFTCALKGSKKNEQYENHARDNNRGDDR